MSDKPIDLVVYAGQKKEVKESATITAEDMFKDIQEVLLGNLDEIGACDDMFLVFSDKTGRVGYIAQNVKPAPVLSMIGTIEVLKSGVIVEYGESGEE